MEHVQNSLRAGAAQRRVGRICRGGTLRTRGFHFAIAGCSVLILFLGRGTSSGKPLSESGGIDWVPFSGGRFIMGSDNVFPNEGDHYGPTQPPHRVTIPKFQLAKTLVTNRQYKNCVDAGACSPPHFDDGQCQVLKSAKPITVAPGILPEAFRSDDEPVVCVDWNQAQTFSRWVGGRLPTEAEWEFAAKGGEKERKYPWGAKKWNCARSDDGLFCPSSRHPRPVCFRPQGKTPEGLCDMAGMVSQWTQDWFHDTYVGAPDDGSAWEYPVPAKGGTEYYGRVTRGSGAQFGSLSAYRGAGSNLDPEFSFYDVGFRPSR